MKKVLVGLILLAALFAFAAEATFSIGTKFTFTGTVQFELLINDKGIDLSGSPLTLTSSIALSPTSAAAAGATFSLTYGFPTAGTSIGVNFSLSRISFTTPYFNATWFVGRPNISRYFTGRNADDSGWQAAYGAQFTDYLLLTVPNLIKDLELYYVDKSTEGTKHYFSDMFLVRYKFDPFTIVAGSYNTGNPATTTAALTDTQNHEFGAHVEGTIDLGFYKPSIRVFGGMVDTANRLEMKTAYEFQLTGAYNPIKELTITPTIRVTENLNLLDYKSDFVSDAKFVQANIKYSQAFGPVTPTISVTPKYDFAATPTTTVKLDEATLDVKFDPVTAKVRVTNDDLLDQNKKYTLYTEATAKIDPFSVTAKAFWPDLTAPATYTYIEVRSRATFSLIEKNDLLLQADYAMITAAGGKNGYLLRAQWNLNPNTFICARYTTILDNDNNGLYDKPGDFLADPQWRIRLVYSATF